VIRRKLLQNTDLHTILRLPTGIFYAQGVKANVIFFDNRAASPDPQTSQVWYYDYRTNVHHTLKQKPLTYGHLEDFVACYRPENRHERQATWTPDTPDGRWRAFTREELALREKASLDVFWLRDASTTDLENLPEPDVLAEEIRENLRAALGSFESVIDA
jgi:type I restriction enzyme M protein